MRGRYRYIIIGGGLAGASAVKGIRERDREGGILLIGAEAVRPYDRPPLTKKLWSGKKRPEDIFLHPPGYYEDNGVDLVLGKRAVRLNVNERTVLDETGAVYGYGRLLIATGGAPRRLEVPGGETEGIIYYRYLDDYTRLRERARQGSTAVVAGGGFIGSEIAAALNSNGVEVTMLFPSPYLCSRVFPEPLGRAVQDGFAKRGVKVLPGAVPASFAKKGGRFVTATLDNRTFESDMVVVGAGIIPSAGLAADAGLKVDDGICVDGFLRTSVPDVFAAGDCAYFPYKELGMKTRVEHWDNSLSQGALAGGNMAGGMEEYSHMPYFFSDLFDFGYEAVGEVSSRLETFADWREENRVGVVYYMKDWRVRGVMLCNIWDRVEEARELIRKGARLSPESLKGAIS